MTKKKNQRKSRKAASLDTEQLDNRGNKGADTLYITSETGNDNENSQNSKGVDTLETIKTKKPKRKKTEWLKPVRKPSEKEARKMFGKALEMMLTLCMSNHVYQFGN